MTDGAETKSVSAILPRGMYAEIADAYEPIIMIGSEPVRTHEEAIYRSIRLLAGQCDGAQSWDGVGFSKLHASKGKRLAEMPFSQWGARELWAARQILNTYKNTQIREWWQLIPDVPEPEHAETQQIVRSYERARPQVPQIRTVEPRRVMLVDRSRDVNARYLMGGFDGEVIQFTNEFNREIIDRIKTIPGRAWDAQGRRWLVPLTIETIQSALDVAIDYAFLMPPAVEEAMRRMLDRIAESAALSYAPESAFEPIGIPEGLSLLPFQKAGVEFAVTHGNVLFGDEMGLGKTVEALATAIHLDLFPLVIICPSSIKAKWGRECNKWCPTKRTVVMDARSTTIVDPERYDIFVINYDIIDRYVMHFAVMDPKCIICDEAHKLKNPGAKRTKNVELLRAAVPQARLLFLSGTAFVNRPMEVATLIKLLGHMDLFGDMTQFRLRYNTSWLPALRELGDKMRQHFMIRRLKKDVLTELPDKYREGVPLDIDNWHEYWEWERNLAVFMADKKAALAPFDKGQAMEEGLAAGIEYGPELIEYVHAAEKRFRGDTWDAHYAVVAQREALLRWEQLKQIAVKGKKRAVFNWLDEFLEETDDQKIVVFATHTEFIKELAARYKCRYIIGGMTAAEKDAVNLDFQNNPATRMIVGNIQAMGEGIDLFAAWHVAFVELGWSPKDHAQAEDRCHRMGQTHGVVIHYLTAEGTIEDEIANLIERKLEMGDAIMQGNGMEIINALTDRLEQRVSSRRR